MKKSEMIENLRKVYLSEKEVFYAGGKFIANYGKVDDELSYKEAKYILNNCNVEMDNCNIFFIDKTTKKLSSNMFINERGNVLFIDDGLSHYFSKSDSKKIVKYFNIKGKKRTLSLEELFKIVG